MSAKIEIAVEARSAASPAAVYAVAKDSEGYPRWSRIGSFEHLVDGAGERFGVGSRRRFRTPPLNLTEEVVELIPDRRVSYILLTGLPFKGYRADIDLTPAEDGGTLIHWSNHFAVTWPLMRGFFARFMRGVFNEMAPQLAREAERLEGL
jgi:uncharacterized protein YndB with AHSA1/START domain